MSNIILNCLVLSGEYTATYKYWEWIKRTNTATRAIQNGNLFINLIHINTKAPIHHHDHKPTHGLPHTWQIKHSHCQNGFTQNPQPIHKSKTSLDLNTHTCTHTDTIKHPFQQTTETSQQWHTQPVWERQQNSTTPPSSITNSRKTMTTIDTTHTRHNYNIIQSSSQYIHRFTQSHKTKHKSTIHGHIHKRLPADPKTPLLLCHGFESHTRIHTTSNTTPTTLTWVQRKPMTHKWFHTNHLPTRVHQ